MDIASQSGSQTCTSDIRRERAEAVIQVVEPVYRVSNTIWLSILTTLFVLVKIILLLPRVMLPKKVVAFCVAFVSIQLL